VTIRPGFSETVPEIRLTFRTNFLPDFVRVFFLFFRFYSVFLMLFFRIETVLDLVCYFPDEKMVPVLRTEQ